LAAICFKLDHAVGWTNDHGHHTANTPFTTTFHGVDTEKGQQVNCISAPGEVSAMDKEEKGGVDCGHLGSQRETELEKRIGSSRP
jgi:hypothetical protein